MVAATSYGPRRCTKVLEQMYNVPLLAKSCSSPNHMMPLITRRSQWEEISIHLTTTVKEIAEVFGCQ